MTDLNSKESNLIHPLKSKSLFGKLREYFLSGLLFSAPLFLTVGLVFWFVQMIDHMVRPIMPKSFTFIDTYIPGYGILVVLGVSTLIGALGKGVFGRYFLRYSEHLLSKMPIIRSVYMIFKQISQAILDQDSSSFREVGLLQYPRSGLWTICFITSTTTGEVKAKTPPKTLNVFVPTTPNPTSGFLLFVPAEEVIILDMSVEDGIKMVVSAGVITPNYKSPKK